MVPPQAGYLFPFYFLGAEPPERQASSASVFPEPVTLVLKEFEVHLDLRLLVLDDHALHEFDTELHGFRVNRVTFRGFLLVLALPRLLVVNGEKLLLALLPLLVPLLLLALVHLLFDVLHVLVIDNALAHLAGPGLRLRGLRRDHTVPRDLVKGLRLPLGEVELVPQRVLLLRFVLVLLYVHVDLLLFLTFL